ncbi:hypothetical protein [Streptomyces niveus]|uniref:hypothetical protein n=1 Tax=Streptomyces niveus TaxID=193462 RepID=UPI0003C620FC|nr:hypothetical protein [Streptomyces niveus]EST17870.1 hypothetical protein M877_40135 [Streptomyces niveus NCIMB 11891]
MTTNTPNPSFRGGSNAIRGGLDITISLTPREVEALGPEAGLLADWFDTALWALTLLRNGDSVRGADADSVRAATVDSYYTVINDLDHRLLPRLQGIRDAAIRRHQELGGTLADLSLAMDVVKSTAQSRRNVVLNREPSRWESWAANGGPDRNRCQECGYPARPGDALATTEDGYQIHTSHTTETGGTFSGARLVAESETSKES